MDYNKCVVMDIECFKNYLLVMFKKVSNGKTLYFEKYNGEPFNRDNVLHLLNKYTIVTYNGFEYDSIILDAAIMGLTNDSIYKISKTIIESRKRSWQVRKEFGIGRMDYDHIDLIQVAPLKASLKMYAGRLSCKTMQDLPKDPDSKIQDSDLNELRKYCQNDLDDTELLMKSLEKAIDLRAEMGKEYGVDLRSKSDAQIAEAVIKYSMEQEYGMTPKRPTIEVGTRYKFKAPSSLVFQNEQLKEIFNLYINGYFTVNKSGHVDMPAELRNKTFTIGDTKYKIGVGGLHSCEKKSHHSSDKYLIKDYDVAAYYPSIILINKLSPSHLGKAFLKIFRDIVNRRLKAKKEGNTVVNESLKITINGTFGKLASKWSFLYAPDLMMQVTVTGQLSLLMLIERLEEVGISVVSANTDGIVVKMLPEFEELVKNIVSDWEIDTGYEMEETIYKDLYSRDVNNYIAVSKDKIKTKGAYADPRVPPNILKKNPTNEICVDAVKLYLKDGTPIEDTIWDCEDISKFVTIRTVKGGAEYNGEYIGKSIRWYYGRDELDYIRYISNGNKVPRTDGAVPLMTLPEVLPKDLDYEWYENECIKILKEIGCEIS